MKILISSRSFGGRDSRAVRSLTDAGLAVVMNPSGRKLTESELIGLIDDGVVGIIAGTEKITEKVIAAAPALKVISRFGVGLDNIDLVAAERAGVAVTSTPDAPTTAVAELTLTLMLCMLKRFSETDSAMRTGKWQPVLGNTLSGKTVGIVGLGRIGKALVTLLGPFRTKIVVFDIEPDEKFIKDHKLVKADLKKLISMSDIITLHLPLTDRTRNIIGSAHFAIMKPNAILINTARGGLIDESALIDALERKAIGGAAIDAFEKEPYAGKLTSFGNVVLTPHIGSYTAETRELMELESAENLIKVLKGLKVL